MKQNKSTRYQWSKQAHAASVPIRQGTVASVSHGLAMTTPEPLCIILDSALTYAQAYAIRYGSKLCDDGFLGPRFLEMIRGVRGLLNGDGAVAMAVGSTQDSKDNGWCEAIFWRAMEASGFKESDL